MKIICPKCGFLFTTDPWGKRGFTTILLRLRDKPMRYKEIKEKTQLPHATLSRRLKDLLNQELAKVTLVPTPTSYYVAYQLTRKGRHLLERGDRG